MFQELAIDYRGNGGQWNLNIVTSALQRWTGTVGKDKRGWEMRQQEMTWGVVRKEFCENL
jgi:hypothetical protein